MIIKSYDLKNNLHKDLYLFHGENDGHKEMILNELFKTNFNGNTYNYFEKEILSNLDNFYNLIFSKSFFDDEKLIIIKGITDKLGTVIEDIFEKKIEKIKIILISGILEKKSKLRNIFEKNKNLISVAFYLDNNQTLQSLALNFFRSKKISISNETINLLVNRAKGERKNLINELDKISLYSMNKKVISFEEINLLSNITESNDINELIENCLAKNNKKIIDIINENNFLIEDTVSIVRSLLFKAKRLLILLNNYSKLKNVDQTISNHKPPIFWKDKEIVKKQIKNWSIKQVEKLILDINEIELLIKKNNTSSRNIVLDFIISKSQPNIVSN